jgi:hypothetical protein
MISEFPFLLIVVGEDANHSEPPLFSDLSESPTAVVPALNLFIS